MTKFNIEKVITGNVKIVRNINRATILNVIREMHPVSRSAIARITGLTKTTVSSIVLDLLNDNFIYEQISNDSNVGRTPIMLHLMLEENYIGAIDIGPDTSVVAIADLQGTIIKKAFLKTDVKNPGRLILSCIEKLKSLKLSVGTEKLRGVGVSIAGVVDGPGRRVIFAPNLGWQNLKIGHYFDEFLPDDGPMTLDNEANASAIAELWFGGEVSGLSNFVFISEGLGTGLIIGDSLFKGFSHAAGEFSHMTIVEHGLRCVCGNLGCWEAYASDRVTVERYKKLRTSSLNISIEEYFEYIIDRANEGEVEAISVLKETGKYLGLGISNIIKGLDPEAIVFGGLIIRAWDIVYPEIQNEIKRRRLSGISQNTLILPSSLSERSSLIGAATLVIKDIFRGHRIEH